MKIEKNKKYLLSKENISSLVQILQKQKFKTIAPVVKDETILYDEIQSIDELPIGMTDVHKAGSYSLKKRKDKALFGYNVGPQSCKKFLFPPKLTLLQTKKIDGKVTVIKSSDPVEKLALIGIKPCELSAILVQDKIFIEGDYVDSYYKQQRDNLFIVTTNCTETAYSCFCDSMKTGPEATKGFDLAVTELIDGKNHRFVIKTGSAAGVKVLSNIEGIALAPDDALALEEAKISSAKNKMGRSISTENLKELLLDNLNHPYWAEIQERCVSCGNCTMVCPTCFCSDILDETSLSGEDSKRTRLWDSCFSKDYSYIHGGVVRASIKSRYRQWLTHKFASWVDQFDTFGCVGCGRCIVWCPVGIDVTEEINAIEQDVEKMKPVEVEA
ncbi:MAG: sulfite reductase subunit A [Calditrichaeota bacterium]|nr:MAG: sulfite reductase subunit A [Calditrichota bacterium]